MIYLLLGSNLGDREGCLRAACGILEEELGVCLRCTPPRETVAVGFEGPDFLNLAACFERPGWLTPERLLEICQSTEQKLGRPHHEAQYNDDGTRKYASRTIDIDILAFDDVRCCSEKLRLPHPQIESRPFVAPLLNELK